MYGTEPTNVARPHMEVLEGRLLLDAAPISTAVDTALPEAGDAVIMVSTLEDELDGDYSEGDLSLREAMLLSDEMPGQQSIHFAESLHGNDSTIHLDPDLGSLTAYEPVDIVGPGSSLMRIEGTGRDTTTFDLPYESDISTIRNYISGLTISRGRIDCWSLDIRDSVIRNDAGIMGAGKLVMDNCIVSDNDWRGVHWIGQAEITNSIFSRNADGGMLLDPTFGHSRIENTVFQGNMAEGSDYDPQAAFLLRDGSYDSTVKILGCTFSGNDTRGIQAYGDYYFGFVSLLHIEDCDFTENTGRGISISTNHHDRATVTDSRIIGNLNGGVSGGGTYLNCTIANNIEGYRGGGALGARLIGCLVEGNISYGDGGGAFESELIHCQVINNTAYGEGGGAFGSQLQGCEVSGNTAYGNGGGVSQSQTRNTRISDNVAHGNGGGVYSSSTNFTETKDTTQCLIDGNVAMGQGGGVYLYRALLAQSTVINNISLGEGLSGGGVYSSLPPWTIGGLQNTIVMGNYSISQPCDIGGVVATASYNLIGDAASAGGLVDGVAGNIVGHDARLDANYAPLPDSPAIDAGRNENLTYMNIPTDFRGYTRVYDGDGDGTPTVDIGAFEFGPAGLAGDANGDGVIDAVDLAAVGLGWDPDGTDATWADGDFNGDGAVDAEDLCLLGETWAPAVPAMPAVATASEDIAYLAEAAVSPALAAVDPAGMATAPAETKALLATVALPSWAREANPFSDARPAIPGPMPSGFAYQADAGNDDLLAALEPLEFDILNGSLT